MIRCITRVLGFVVKLAVAVAVVPAIAVVAAYGLHRLGYIGDPAVLARRGWHLALTTPWPYLAGFGFAAIMVAIWIEEIAGGRSKK